MRVSFRPGLCHRVACGGRILRLACVAKSSNPAKTEPSPVSNSIEHLQRSLDLGPAVKQAPDFEYVAVAFRSQTRSKKRSKGQLRDVRMNSKHSKGLNKIFGESDDSRGYRSLELVSGDRRLLFEPHAMSPTAGPAAPANVVGADSPSVQDGSGGPDRVAAATQGARPARRRRQAGRLAKPEPGPLAAPVAEPSAASSALSSSVTSAASLHPRPAPAGLIASAAPRTIAHGALESPATSPHLPRLDSSVADQPQGPHPSPQTPMQQPHGHLPDQQQQQQQLPQRQQRHGGAHGGGGTATAAAAERLAAAAALLQLSSGELRRHRGFCSELRALDLTPDALAALRVALADTLGLAPAQLRDALLCQPHVLRVPPATLARRGAALALELELPPPPGAGGGGPLAGIVAAVPDVLLRRTGYAGTAAALAAALALPLGDAVALLRREPQLLRHPPGFYERGVAALREQLGLQPTAAAALAAAEPQLLAVSPGVLRANGALLRSRLQLSPEQLAEVVGRAPELLARSHGVLRCAVQRLTAALGRSEAWRAALPRLLASPRNLAVALSFGSDRYDRLEYLAATGRDQIMGFKEGLSLEDAEFQEVFPGYECNVWRQRLARAPVSGSGSGPGSLQHHHQRPARALRPGARAQG